MAERWPRGGTTCSTRASGYSTRPSARSARLQTSRREQARQLSLKLLSNASYGFTGADTSHLCCKPLAEACLRMGNAYTRAASRLVEEAAAGGRIPGAAVLYANTGPRAKEGLVQLS